MRSLRSAGMSSCCPSCVVSRASIRCESRRRRNDMRTIEGPASTTTRLRRRRIHQDVCVWHATEAARRGRRPTAWFAPERRIRLVLPHLIAIDAE
jgi:hypothetical protein